MYISNCKADIKSQVIAFARKKYLMTKGIVLAIQLQRRRSISENGNPHENNTQSGTALRQNKLCGIGQLCNSYSYEDHYALLLQDW